MLHWVLFPTPYFLFRLVLYLFAILIVVVWLNKSSLKGIKHFKNTHNRTWHTYIQGLYLGKLSLKEKEKTIKREQILCTYDNIML